MEALTLREIGQALGLSVDSDAKVLDISTDTREIHEGSVFVAIEGDRFDGHNFVSQAVEKGAVAVVVHKEVQCSVPALVVEDTVQAYLDIAGYYRDKFNIPVVGLTGSVGKTTTKEMTALALSGRFRTLKTEANYNNHIGMPRTLLGLDSTYTAAVIEMGMNHFGEISRLVTQSKPTIGLITNIGVSHIENLGSREGILKAKLELLDGLQPGAPLVLNGDDDLLSTVSLENRPVYFFSVDNPTADFRAVDITESSESTTFTVLHSDFRQKVTLPTVGVHNVLDATSAFAVAYLLGVESQVIADMLATYVPSGMRQRVVKKETYTVIEDCYNASPDSVKASLSMLANLSGECKVAVLGDMLELGSFSESLHQDIGRFVANTGVDKLVCFGTHAKHYATAASEAGLKDVTYCTTREELVNTVCSCAEQGAVLLFKASHCMHFEQVISELYERKG